MSCYTIKITDPKGRVLRETKVDAGLVRASGRDDEERADFILREMPLVSDKYRERYKMDERLKGTWGEG